MQTRPAAPTSFRHIFLFDAPDSLFLQHFIVGSPRRPSAVTVRQGTLLSPVDPLTDTDLARERPTGAADCMWDRATATFSFCAKMTAVTAVSKPTCLALGFRASDALAAGDTTIVLDTMVIDEDSEW